VLDGSPGQLVVRVNRVLAPEPGAVPPGEAGRAALSGTWRLPDGTRVRGVLATARAETP
jgi:hypothetical protein